VIEVATAAKKKGTVRKTAKKRAGENYTPEQRAEWKKERIAEQTALLEAAVKELTSSEAWANFVKFGRVNLHRLSLNNALLIWAQRRDATVVWGEKQWTKQKVNVLPGAQKIRYLAPSGFYWLKDKNGDPILDANGKQQRRMFYRVVTGYDVKDTDAPVSDVHTMVELEGDDLFDHAAALERWARELGYSVKYIEFDDARHGEVNERMGTINISRKLSGNAMVLTLVHELMHVYGNVNYQDYDRATAEVLVESATVMTLGMLGFDVSDASVPYIAAWSNGNLDALTKYMKLVDELVKEAVKRMENDTIESSVE
jgi:hypothetical protein